jgi:hypothetical protein
MSTRVLARTAVKCYHCDKTHQLRVLDRGVGANPRTVAVCGGRVLKLPATIDAHEEFGLAVALVAEFTNRQSTCPITDFIR